jgi:cytidylate kinase
MLTKEEQDRLEVAQQLAKFMSNEYVGTAAIYTFYRVLRTLTAGHKVSISNKMDLVKSLKNKDIELFNKLCLYADEQSLNSLDVKVPISNEKVGW